VNQCYFTRSLLKELSDKSARTPLGKFLKDSEG
jgi:hypothetical protein